MTKLKRLLKRLKLLLFSNKNNWVLLSKYKSSNGVYTHRTYLCCNTGHIKRVTKFGNQKTIIQISTND